MSFETTQQKLEEDKENMKEEEYQQRRVPKMIKKDTSKLWVTS